MSQYVYTMRRVGKVVPPKRVILRNISLNFFPGAKIGVLGLNGAGKSSLLKIMAGVDQDFEGGATPQTHLRGGLLRSGSDWLVVDVPANHLESFSVQGPGQCLERFPCAGIAVTHDRYFLDNVAGWILELGRVYGILSLGNYFCWLEQNEQRLEF